jgi:hypothetical protein
MNLLRLMPSIPLVLLAVATGCGEDEPSCQEIEQEVATLIEANQSCTTHEDCVAGPSFQCFAACGSTVNRTADLDDLRARGRDLDDEYRERSCDCPMPLCADPAQFHLECVENVCTSVMNAR